MQCYRISNTRLPPFQDVICSRFELPLAYPFYRHRLSLEYSSRRNSRPLSSTTQKPSTTVINAPSHSPISPQRRSANPTATDRPKRRISLPKASMKPVGNDFIDSSNLTPSEQKMMMMKKKKKKNKEQDPWKAQKASLQRKFATGWSPRKRLSPDALDGIRALHAQQPAVYTSEVLAAEFEVSPEAIRRILKSRWRPSGDEAEERRLRWERRGESIWTAKASVGYKPPKRWRDLMRERAWEEGTDSVDRVLSHPSAQAIVAWQKEEWRKEQLAIRKEREEREKLRLEKLERNGSSGERTSSSSSSSSSALNTK